MSGTFERAIELQRGRGKDSLKTWLKMLACTTLIEKRLQTQLQEQFGTTLPRFDVLAALSRSDEPMTMSALSRRLLVSNGNVTGLVNRLAEDGHLTREVDPKDRRSVRVRLTESGRAVFDEMAMAHEEWITDIFSSLSQSGLARLADALGVVRDEVDAMDKAEREAA